MEEKIYFAPGDLVTLRQDIPNKPIMLVIKKETNMFRKNDEVILRGFKCRWFTTDGTILEAIFNTKDLIKV